MTSEGHILIVYGQTGYPLRATLRDHLYSFREYAGCHVSYFNASAAQLPSSFGSYPFSRIIFHNLFLSDRWTFGNLDFFNNVLLKHVEPLRKSSVPKTLLTQDEWYHSDAINRFIRDFGISDVFSVAPPGEWPKIFDTVDRKKVNLHYVMTGYIAENLVPTIERLKKEIQERTIFMGYRAYKATPWMGKHGFLKTRIAEVFKNACEERNKTCDISTRREDTIYGDNWYRFLLKCRFVPGVEGGATILDKDGSIWNRGTKYVKEHPDADFDEVEKNCFPGRDGEIKFFAISPRHLECCATSTCQVLVEGSYNGILQPDIHYIPVKADFSNLDEVFTKMENKDYCEGLVRNAYKDVVESGLYTYRAFVLQVLDNSQVYNKLASPSRRLIVSTRLAWIDYRNWKIIAHRNTRKHNLISLIYTTLLRIYVTLRPLIKSQSR
jgi:hypothetical protein